MSECLHCDIHEMLESHLQGEQVDLAEVAARVTEVLADLILMAPPWRTDRAYAGRTGKPWRNGIGEKPRAQSDQSAPFEPLTVVGDRRNLYVRSPLMPFGLTQACPAIPGSPFRQSLAAEPMSRTIPAAQHLRPRSCWLIIQALVPASSCVAPRSPCVLKTISSHVLHGH
jgi:hypothetical protein